IVCVLFLAAHVEAAASPSVAPGARGSVAPTQHALTFPVSRPRAVQSPPVAPGVARLEPIGHSMPERPEGPMEAVWGMFEAFANRSETAYAAWMTDDFQFASDDPDFLASSPAAMDRAAEEQFARHLFRGGKLSPAG